MNYRISVLFIVLLYNISCSTGNNQVCNNENLLKNAAKGASEKILSCYRSGADILISNDDGKSIYAIAYENGHKELAVKFQKIQFKEWQENGSKLQAQDLYDAIEYNNSEMVKIFIDGGFDIKAKHINGVAPVVYAIFNESNNVLSLLLENGVNASYEFDFRPLICIAAMFNQQNTVNILIKHGADINTKDGSGVTPLMFAARDGSKDLISYLIKNGADTEAVDIEGNTAVDMAKLAGHKEVIGLLTGQ